VKTPRGDANSPRGLFSCVSNLVFQAFRVTKHVPRNDLAFAKLKDSNALIGDLPSRAGKTE
jgi:hypothetical protein